MLVEKRDGRTVEYDKLKIASAVHQAMHHVGVEPEPAPANEGEGKCNSFTISSLVDAKIQELNLEQISVEAIQDLVEKVLIEQNLPEVAKHYILYRDKRSTMRSIHSKMNRAISGLINPSEDSDDKRENANINSDTTMGTMLKIGTTVTKDFNLKNVYKPEYSKLHNTGYIHMHDLDFSSLCVNCLYIPLAKLLRDGYSTGHGFLRSPKSIRAASALACIAIQSSQNDFFEVY